MFQTSPFSLPSWRADFPANQQRVIHEAMADSFASIPPGLSGRLPQAALERRCYKIPEKAVLAFFGNCCLKIETEKNRCWHLTIFEEGQDDI
ncbi:MAG: hypothetical protein LBJ14_02505 [Desulfarculales bacterium]|nr:hypothetical protein [Desulfarculales bacterium]